MARYVVMSDMRRCWRHNEMVEKLVDFQFDRVYGVYRIRESHDHFVVIY